MITPLQKKVWEKQQYRIVGSHSAVKTCHWTKNMIKGEGGCYKLKFYGIISNQCMQMTTSMSCANICSFCWRDYKSPVSREWKWKVDDPNFILNESIKMHHSLLSGLKGHTLSIPSYNSSKTVKHVALSLTGEPITYPKINELINLFNKQEISTFLVTNAQYPEQIKNLNQVTQLYISVDAPNKELLKEIDRPLFSDYWERLNQSLHYMSKKKQRTCIRLTLIKKINMLAPEGYASLILKASPAFIEAKAYMFLGASRTRLEKENMPTHEEVLEFSRELEKFLPDYEIVSEHIHSKVVMLAKKKFKKKGKWYTWIDFNKYNKLALSKKEFTTEDYLKQTPLVNIIKLPT